jgi:hypothetical protein
LLAFETTLLEVVIVHTFIFLAISSSLSDKGIDNRAH